MGDVTTALVMVLLLLGVCAIGVRILDRRERHRTPPTEDRDSLSLSALDMLDDPRSTIAEIQRAVAKHPPTELCPDMECLICGYRDCPHHEPLHYHHDGCPRGYFCGWRDPKEYHCACPMEPLPKA